MMSIEIKVALIGLFGALLGGLISCGTTFFVELVKFKRDDELHTKRNRENIYLELLKYITHINANRKIFIENHTFPDEEKAKYNNILVKCKLYGTKKLSDKFYNFMRIIINDIENTMYTNTDINYDDIFEEARKELKIED